MKLVDAGFHASFFFGVNLDDHGGKEAKTCKK